MTQQYGEPREKDRRPNASQSAFALEFRAHRDSLSSLRADDDDDGADLPGIYLPLKSFAGTADIVPLNLTCAQSRIGACRQRPSNAKALSTFPR